MKKETGQDPAAGLSEDRYAFRPSDDGSTLCLDIFSDQLDARVASELKTDFGRVWDSRCKEVVVDLQEVRFIDSSGVGVLLHIQRKAMGESRPLVLHGVRPAVQQVIRLLRLDRVFLINEI